MDEQVKLSVQDTLTPDELLQQICRLKFEDEESQSAFVQKLQESCKLLQESDAENVTVHTDTSPGEAVELQQQQVQIKDLKPSIQESTKETGARPIPKTNYRSATTGEPPLLTITTKSDNTQPEINIDDQILKERITNCPADREIQSCHHVIFTILQELQVLLSVGFITEGKLWRIHVTDFKLGARTVDGDGGWTEEVKKRLRLILFGEKSDDLRVMDQLEQNLLESLNDMDPVKRLETARRHPIFWSESRKLEFIGTVGDQKEVKRQKLNENQKKKIRSYSNEKTFHNWKIKINEKKPGLVEEMEKARAKYWNQENATYPEHLYGLVRFIRNCMVHRADVAVEMNFTSIFPDLFETVYILAKEKN